MSICADPFQLSGPFIKLELKSDLFEKLHALVESFVLMRFEVSTACSGACVLLMYPRLDLPLRMAC